MPDPGEIKKIIITGGGTAGWMSANYLGKFLARKDASITLIESPSIATIGVGEATLPTLVRFLRNMNFDEREFMQRCKATFKLGIRFENWIRQDYTYWHPFGVCGTFIDGIDLFHFWCYLRESASNRYSDYSLQAAIAGAARAPCQLDGTSHIIESGGYAYHLDAARFAEYLQEKAVAAGIQHIKSDVERVTVDDNNEIECIYTADGGRHTADLYIDCSGFHGLLISKLQDTGFIDWSDTLLCDRAVVLPAPAPSVIHANTCSTAMTAGWCWQIPLADRTGCGYVYSSKHTSAEAATAELTGLAVMDPGNTVEPRHLAMPVGHRLKLWSGNCVAIGLSGGFVEPLESTGIHLIQQGIESLMDHFPDTRFNATLREHYNRRMTDTYEEIRDFILLHYILSEREDTAFWRDSRHVELPGSLQQLLALYDESGMIVDLKVQVFPPTSYYHILSGGNRLPRRANPVIHVSDMNKVREIMQQVKSNHAAFTESLPAHADYIHALPV